MPDPFTLLADLVAWRLLGLTPGARLGDAVHFFVMDVTKIFFLLVVVIFLIGFFRSMLSPERVRKILGGRSRWFGYPTRDSLGAVTPFCSCSSVPLFIGFLEAGIPLGVTMSFLIASPMINEIAVIVLATTLGWEVAVLYVTTGLVVGVVGGLMMEKLGMERYVEDYVWQIRMGQAAEPTVESGFKARVSYAWDQVREMVGRLWPYVLVGIGIGAALHGYVPEEFLLRWAGPEQWFAVPAAVLAGIPMYANATGVIPVAEALLAKSVPIGTVLALMMSVAAISLPEMIILRKVIRVPLIATFAATLAVCFVIVGLLFNALFV